MALLCALAAITLHSMTWQSPPLFDDKLQLTKTYIFTEYLVPFSQATLWQRWLSYGSFAWSHALFGANWPLLRLENVMLHALVTVSLLAFFRRLLERQGQSARPALLLAGGGALMFALSPGTVYAVSYLIQRSIVMAALFSILALMSVLTAVETGRRRWWLVAAILYVLAVSSKEHAVMLPLVAAALAYMTTRSQAGSSGQKYHWYIAIPFLLVASVIAAKYHAWIATPFDETSQTLIKELAQNHPAVAEHAYLLSVMNETTLFFKYLLIWLLPIPGWLSIDMRQPFPLELTAWPQAIGPVLYLLYGVGALYLLRKRQETALLGFGLLVPWLLFPTELATVWIQDPFVVYRSYLWMIGLPAILPWLYRRLGTAPTAALLAAMLLGSAWASMEKLSTFKSEFTLWDDAVRYNETAADPRALGRERAYNERAGQYAQMDKAAEALADYGKALAINPKDPSLYANRAALQILLNNYGAAEADLAKALQLDPLHPHARYNRAAMYARQGQEEQALRELDAILSEPRMVTADAYNTRATLLLKRQRFDQAAQDLTEAIRLQPDNAPLYTARGGARLATGDAQGALADYGQALALNPSLIVTRTNRALLQLQMGKHQAALADADAAVALDALQARPHLVRAQIYVTMGRIDDALAEYDRMLERNPNEAVARLNRGEVAMAVGRLQAARSDLEAACKLGLAQGCAKLASLPKKP
ncbi:MAG: tetratricopeptide repeat protein [Betaproteobacteria bacterium]|nr:tetratricopeptide repeat protein [Betaproteobacteria bacterium]